MQHILQMENSWVKYSRLRLTHGLLSCFLSFPFSLLFLLLLLMEHSLPMSSSMFHNKWRVSYDTEFWTSYEKVFLKDENLLLKMQQILENGYEIYNRESISKILEGWSQPKNFENRECHNVQTIIAIYIKIYIFVGMEMSQRIQFWYQTLLRGWQLHAFSP